jgi:glycyl-tRNA synthetase
VASERLPEPIQVERLVAEPNKKLIGPRFKGDQKIVLAALEQLEGAELEAFKTAIETAGVASVTGPEPDCKAFEVSADLVSFASEKRTVVETKYTPSVIEPSFGIGRILYAVLEHSFSQRGGDTQRCVMSFRPAVAPVKVGIYRLINHAPFDPLVARVRDLLHAKDITCRVDSSSGTVGRRYSRSDELGIPFGVTVDFRSLLDDSVTVRDRDSMAQVRVPIANLLSLIDALVRETLTWETVMQRFVVVSTGGEAEEADEGGAAAAAGPASAVSASPVVVEYTTRGSFSRPNPATAGGAK